MKRCATGLLVLLMLCAEAAAAKEITLELMSGEKLIGELVSESAEETVIEHPLFGRLTIPAEEIAPGDREPRGLFGTRALRGWHKELGLGFSGQEGNSPEMNVRVDLDLFRETEDWRWRFDGVYRVATEDGSRTSNYGRLTARRDWLIPGSRWFAVTGSGYEYDQFESWRHRLNVYAGPGYRFVGGETLTLDGLSGLGYTYEFQGGNDGRPEGVLGVELTWKPFDGQRVTFNNYFLPQLNESEFRNLTRAEWKMRVAGTEHVSLVLGIDNEYDTAAEDRKNNLKYWSSLAYEF